MPSSSCCILYVFYIAGNQYQTESKCNETPGGFFGPEESHWAKEALGGLLEGSSIHQGAPGGPGAPWWVVPTSGAPWTDSLLYKYPNIPETLGESTKSIPATASSKNHRSNLDTITEGFIILIGASLMMRE